MFSPYAFGLSSACYVFTELLRPLVGYRWSKGHCGVPGRWPMYCIWPGLCEGGKRIGSRSLGNAGLVTHPDKSVWEPPQCLIWLGFVIDLALGEIRIPEVKGTALSQTRAVAYLLLRELQAYNSILSVSLRISMSLAIGPVARFMTRSLYTGLDSRNTWCECLPLSLKARDKLEFWENCWPIMMRSQYGSPRQP